MLGFGFLFRWLPFRRVFFWVFLAMGFTAWAQCSGYDLGLNDTGTKKGTPASSKTVNQEET